MITLIVALCLLGWAAKFGDLGGWGFWLALLVMAFLTDCMLRASIRDPIPPPPLPREDAVIHDVETRLAKMRESTRRTLEKTAMPGDAEHGRQ